MRSTSIPSGNRRECRVYAGLIRIVSSYRKSRVTGFDVFSKKKGDSMYNKFRFIVVLVILIVSTAAFRGFTADGSHMGEMGSSAAVPATENEKTSFVELWKKVFESGGFTPGQTEKLAAELKTASLLLADNFKVLSSYLEKKKTAPAADVASIDKRIDVAEAERDLIASETKLALDKFLTREQVDLVQVAVFHGISMTLSDEKHLEGMTGGTGKGQGRGVETLAELGKLAAKLNLNCEAVTLSLLLATLPAPVSGDGPGMME